MPRRYRPPKRQVSPDPRHDNVNLAMFINRIMVDGKKSVARRLVYDALDLIEERDGNVISIAGGCVHWKKLL